MFDSVEGSLSSILQMQFIQDVTNMGGNCAYRDIQVQSNLTVR